MSENIYEMVCESKIMYGIEVKGMRHGENDIRFTGILQEINEYTELCSQWTCWDGTWQRDEKTQVHWTDCKILVLDYVFGYRRSSKKMLWMTEE